MGDPLGSRGLRKKGALSPVVKRSMKQTTVPNDSPDLGAALHDSTSEDKLPRGDTYTGLSRGRSRALPEDHVLQPLDFDLVRTFQAQSIRCAG